MPGNLQKLVIPTGYETQEEEIARRRKLAEAMQEAGLAANPNIRSWTQVLAQIADAYEGQHQQKLADTKETALGQQIRDAYGQAIQGYYADKNNPAISADQRLQKWSMNPFLQGSDILKPDLEGQIQRSKSANEIKSWGPGYAYGGDVVGTGPAPPKPDDSVFLGTDGRLHTNVAKQAYGLASQALIPNQEYSTPANPAFTKGFSGMPSTAGQQATLSPGGQPPLQSPNPQANTIDTSVMTPQERQILQAEIARRKQAQSNGVTLPTSGTKPPPNGMTTDGRPYWIVNGQPFDNPEGN